MVRSFDILKAMQQWLERMQTALPAPPDIQLKIALSVLAILILWLAHRIVLRLVWTRSEDVRVRYRWRKISNYITVILTIVIMAVIWFQLFRSLGTFLGLLSAGLAIALKDLVANVAGWLFIVWRRPFGLGDRIQIGRNSGDVVDIRIFEFTLMEIGNWVDADQSTGRVVHVPNGRVLSEPMANYTRGFNFIWNEIPVLVTFESDWEKAKGILMKIAEEESKDIETLARQRMKEAARQYLIVFTKLTPTVYTSVKDSGVMLTIRYLTKPRQRRGTAQAIWERILREFAQEPDIELAYPTIRYYDRAEDIQP